MSPGHVQRHDPATSPPDSPDTVMLYQDSGSSYVLYIQTHDRRRTGGMRRPIQMLLAMRHGGLHRSFLILFEVLHADTDTFCKALKYPYHLRGS